MTDRDESPDAGRSSDIPAKPADRATRERAYKAEYRARNAERIREYRAKYNEAHREEIRPKKREYMRRRSSAEAKRQDRLEKRRDYSRSYYAKNREAYLDAQRESRARRKAADPAEYRRLARERQARWRSTRREAINEKQRERYEADPEPKRRAASQYYAENRERILARQRIRWAEQHDELLAHQRAYRARERRRREAGLPARRVHRTRVAERRANQRAAGEFFARTRTDEQIDAIKEEAATDPDDLARWHRDSARARASFHFETDPGVSERSALAQARRAEREARDRAQAEEDARMDAIAQELNDRLRRAPRHRPNSVDPAAPHRGQHPPSSSGLNR